MMIPVMMIAMDMTSVGIITTLPIHRLCMKGEELVVLAVLLEDINIRIEGGIDGACCNAIDLIQL